MRPGLTVCPAPSGPRANPLNCTRSGDWGATAAIRMARCLSTGVDTCTYLCLPRLPIFLGLFQQRSNLRMIVVFGEGKSRISIFVL